MNVFNRATYVLLFILHLSASKECVIDNRSREIAWEEQLRQNLHTCSNRHVPPDINNTEVYLDFTLKSFYFDQSEEIFSINTLLIVVFRDPRLAWNPNEFDGISETVLSSMFIWTPKLKQCSTGSEAGFDEIDFYGSVCRVHSVGEVLCMPRNLHQTACSLKLELWPYDTQSCTFSFGSRSKSDRVTFTFNSSHIGIMAAKYGPSWTIINQKIMEDSKEEVQFHLNFELERQGVGLAAVVVVPPLILSVLTFTTLLLNVDDGIRLGLLCFGLLNQFSFLQEISSDIPKNGADAPTVLLYLRSSLILTLLAIGITFLLRYLRKKNSSPPNIVLVSTEKVFDSYARYLIWPRWDVNISINVNDEPNIKHVSIWTDFANIINSVSMVIIAVVSVTYFFAYIPQQPPDF